MSDVGRRIVAIGAFSSALAVALGAFGAHVLEQRVPAGMLAIYETGARYHFYHSLGLVAVGLLGLARHDRARRAADSSRGGIADRRLRWSAACMLTGIVLFSGSLYTMALTGMRWLGAVTPFGGVAFLAGWVLFASAALATDAHETDQRP